MREVTTEWAIADLTSAPKGSMDDGTFRPNAGYIAVLASDGTHVCDIFPFGAKRNVPYEKALEHANLIAAAPDLLAALEFIRDGYDNQDVNHVDFRVKAYEVALDAISLALSASKVQR